MATKTLQEQARALGDPTRHAIFRHVAGAAAPVPIAELSEHFPLNHNAIRQHLAKLVAAGLLTESKAARSGRGRPPVVYAVDPELDGRWGTTGSYERLSRLLVEVIRSGDRPEAVGRRYGGSLRDGGGDALDRLQQEMARHGFRPERRQQAAAIDLVLRTCPFETAAAVDRATVCAIHLGIAHGLAEGTDVVVDELVANHPRTANCRLRLRAATEPAPATTSGALTIRR